MGKRFTVDDIFCLWDTKNEDTELFIEEAIAYHPTHIKFTAEVSEIEKYSIGHNSVQRRG